MEINNKKIEVTAWVPKVKNLKDPNSLSLLFANWVARVMVFPDLKYPKHYWTGNTCCGSGHSHNTRDHLEHLVLGTIALLLGNVMVPKCFTQMDG